VQILPGETEVLVAGLGPVGQAATALLSRLGVDVLGVDPAPGPHREPRAAALDGPALRVLAALGIDLPRLEDPEVVLVGVRGEEIPVPGAEPLALFHQPDLEAALLARIPPGRARFGVRLEGFVQDAEGVLATLEGGRKVRAGWLLGCDGARSAVREACGIAFPGRSADPRWLVLDAEVPAPLDPRPRVRFVGDPARPGVSLPLSPRHHRWEVALAPGDDGSALRAPPGAREVRRATYVHHARRASRWRAGRVLLLGDAAHVMPPFAGQGLAHGLRDAGELAWKLAAVLEGDAAPGLLDSYERERAPVVAAATRLARLWGALVGLRRPRLARGRDLVLGVAAARAPALVASARALPAPRRGAFGPPPGGTAFPLHVEGWTLVAREGDPRRGMGERDRALWERLCASYRGAPEVRWWFDRWRTDVVAVRPDGVVLTAAGSGDVARLATAYRRWMGQPSGPGRGAPRMRRSATVPSVKRDPAPYPPS